MLESIKIYIIKDNLIESVERFWIEDYNDRISSQHAQYTFDYNAEMDFSVCEAKRVELLNN